MEVTFSHGEFSIMGLVIFISAYWRLQTLIWSSGLSDLIIASWAKSWQAFYSSIVRRCCWDKAKYCGEQGSSEWMPAKAGSGDAVEKIEEFKNLQCRLSFISQKRTVAWIEVGKIDGFFSQRIWDVISLANFDDEDQGCNTNQVRNLLSFCLWKLILLPLFSER